MGANSTQLWLREFNNYRQYFADDDSNFYETLRAFLRISFNKQWKSFIHWAEQPQNVSKQTSVRMQTTIDQKFLAKQNIRSKILFFNCIQNS